VNVELAATGLADSRPPRPLSNRRFLLLLAIWLAAAPWLLFPEQRPALTALGVCLLLIIWLAGWRYFFPFQGSLHGYIVLYLGLTALAFFVSPLPQTSLPKLLTIFLGVTGFYLVSARLRESGRLTEPGNLWYLITALALAGGLIAFLGLFTLEWPQRQVLDLRMITGRLPHLSGDFSINFNEMAGTLLLLLPFVWATLRAEPSDIKGRRWRLAAWASLLLIIVVLLLTQSRGAFLGLLVAVLAGYWWGRFPIRRLLLLLLITLGLLLLVALVTNWGSTDLFTWLDEMDANSKTGHVPTSSWLSRLEIWRNAGQMLRDYPVLGAGLYTFEPVARANYVFELSPPILAITHAHNLFLQDGTSLGWSGLLLLVLFWSHVMYRLWCVGRQAGDPPNRLAAIFGASLTGYLAFNLFDTISLGQKPGVLVWLVLAGSVALFRGQAQSVPSAFQPWRAHLGPLLPLLLFVGLALSPLLARNRANLALDRVRFGPGDAAGLQVEQFAGDPRRQGLLEFLSGRPAEALAYWRDDPQAAVFLGNQGLTAAEDDRLGESLVWYELALAFDAESSLVHYWQAEVYEAQGLVEQALDSYQKAVSLVPDDDLSPHSQAWIYFDWGHLLAQQKQWAAAVEAYEQAISLRSDLGYYYQALGDALNRLGDKEGAAAAYDQARAIEAGG
jgi:O-antigen ligase